MPRRDARCRRDRAASQPERLETAPHGAIVPFERDRRTAIEDERHVVPWRRPPRARVFPGLAPRTTRPADRLARPCAASSAAVIGPKGPVCGDRVCQGAQPPVLGRALGQRKVDPGAERIRTALCHRLVASLNHAGIDRHDQPRFAHTLIRLACNSLQLRRGSVIAAFVQALRRPALQYPRFHMARALLCKARGHQKGIGRRQTQGRNRGAVVLVGGDERRVRQLPAAEEGGQAELPGSFHRAQRRQGVAGAPGSVRHRCAPEGSDNHPSEVGKGQQEFLIVKLSDVIITGVTTAAVRGSDPFGEP